MVEVEWKSEVHDSDLRTQVRTGDMSKCVIGEWSPQLFMQCIYFVDRVSKAWTRKCVKVGV